MELNLITTSDDNKLGKMKVSLETFGREFNEPLVHQVVTSYLSGARAGTKAQKSRSQVSGGGAKPWKQKGGGRARAGSSRSPIWRKGGVVFAASPRDYSQKVNKKMYRGAMKSILSELARHDRIILADSFTVDEPKTKALVNKLKLLGLNEVLIITESLEESLYLAARNLNAVDIRDVSSIDPVSLITFEKILITVPALKQIEEMLA